MDRRKLIKDILTAVAGGVALGATSSAAAKAFGMDKYAKMVRLQADLIATHKLVATDWKDAEKRAHYNAMISPKVDTVLTYAMDNFTGDEKSAEAFAACSQIFKGREFCDTLDEDKLKEILEVVVPVAVARNLLAYHRVTFDPKKVSSWDKFSDKYQDMILAA